MEVSPKYYLPIAGGLIIVYIFYKNYKKKHSNPDNPPADSSEKPLEPETESQKKDENSPDTLKFNELKVLLSESLTEGWDTIKDTEGLKVHKKITESSPIAIIKARLVLKNTHLDDAFFAIWDGNFRREWDNVAKDFHVVSQTNESTDIIYFYAASPIPAIISNREFLQHRRYVKDSTGVYIIYWSADMPERPVPENWVRANTILSGYYITQTADGVVVEFISQNDIKGKIPPKMINALAPSKALEWAKKFTKACELLKGRNKREF